MGVIAGRGSLRVDGVVFNCTEIVPTLGSETSEKVVGFSGPAGDKTTPVAPMLTATVIVTEDVDVIALQRYRDVTVEVQMADGRSYVFEGATQTNQLAHSVAEGTCDVEFDAMTATGAG